jgi:hypothetical protein
MAIIVEDGTGVVGANSYVSVAELEAFAAARGITIVGDPETLLIRAMDYIETLDYCGRKLNSVQSLQWPRYGVWVDGYPYAVNTIPTELKNALMQTALSIDAGVDPLSTIPRVIHSASVGPMSVTYQDGSNTETIRSINAYISKLIACHGGTSFHVYRGS